MTEEKKEIKGWVKFVEVPYEQNHIFTLWKYGGTDYKDRCVIGSILLDDGKWEFFINDNYDFASASIDSSGTFATRAEAEAAMAERIKDYAAPKDLPTCVGMCVNLSNLHIDWVCKQAGIPRVNPGGFTF